MIWKMNIVKRENDLVLCVVGIKQFYCTKPWSLSFLSRLIQVWSFYMFTCQLWWIPVLPLTDYFINYYYIFFIMRVSHSSFFFFFNLWSNHVGKYNCTSFHIINNTIIIIYIKKSFVNTHYYLGILTLTCLKA